MYKKILVPLDGSELAEMALAHVTELVGRVGLEAILLYVCPTEERSSTAVNRAYVEHAAEAFRKRWEEAQQKAGIPAGDKTITVRGELAVSSPAEGILRYADENNIDLIVMATHGRSGIKRWAMGSVADKVLRASKVPVWLVRAGVSQEAISDKLPRRTMVVPLDGSKRAESVLPHVEALAKQRGTETVDIILLAVCEPTVLPSFYPDVAPIDLEADLAICQQTNKAYLAGVERRLRDSRLTVQSKTLTGRPADMIIDFAKANPSVLIVMATHGRSGVSRWVFGSVADKVLSGASNPIFLVRSQEDD